MRQAPKDWPTGTLTPTRRNRTKGFLMAATTTKQRTFTTLLSALKKGIEPTPRNERAVLEQLLYSVLRESAPKSEADRAFRNLRERFYDWNELRVSTVHEVVAALGDLPQPNTKAQRLIELLQEIFEATYSYDMESIHKKGVKQAAKQIARYRASSDFAVAWVTQRSLEGHAVPLDEPMLRTLKRLGMIDESVDNYPAAMAAIEHQVPKAKGEQFVEAINFLAHDRCGETPRCTGCPMKSECPSAGLRPARPAKVKPR